MKRTIAVFLALLMVFSFGMANALTFSASYENVDNLGVELTSIGYYTKDDRIIEAENGDLFDHDSFGNSYSTLIYPNIEEGQIEYLLNGAYTTLEADIYLPEYSLKYGESHRWDHASISIYGDDTLLGTISGFSAYDEPLPIIVCVENVRVLRIEFDDVYCYYHGMTYPLAAIGDPMLTK